MNIKETILNTLKDNILNIQKQNGYLSDIQNVFIGSSDIQNLNSFPVCTVGEGNSKVLKNYNAKGDELIEMDILVKFYVEQTPDVSNTISSINVKSDFKKLIYGDKNILVNYLSTLHQIPEIKKIVIEQETGILEYNSKIEYTIVLLKIEYISKTDHIDGSSYEIVIPNVLSNYSLTSHQHPQYFLNSNSGSLTGATINLSGYATTGSLTGYSLTNHTHSNYALTGSLSAYSLTSHTHTIINNALNVVGTLTNGQSISAYGIYNFSNGFKNYHNAFAQYSASFGSQNSNYANYSFTVGSSNRVNGQGGVAMGSSSTAGGQYSFAFGQYAETENNAHYSFSMGLGTFSNSPAQFVVGKYNFANTNLFTIGNGASNGSRSNIVEVDPNYLNLNGTLYVQQSSTLYGGINFDADEFKSIKQDGEGLIIHNYESDSSPIKLDAGIIVLQDANDNDKNVTIQKNTGTDSCIYFGENKFRIRYSAVNNNLVVEAYYNNVWNETTVLGEI